jgi:hypothetical protein
MLKLPPSSPGEQVQVKGHHVQLPAFPLRGTHRPVQKPPALEPVIGNVEILVRLKRKVAQDRIAVVTLRVHGILAIGMVAPDLVRDELELRLPGVYRMLAKDLLQANDVDPVPPDLGLQLRKNHPLVEQGEALVDIE